MKILFSPSEGKNFSEIISNQDDFGFLDTLPCSGEILKENISKYIQILKEQDETIAKLFGVKNLNSKMILDEIALCSNLGKTSKFQAIKLYSGVAYKALDFDTLNTSAQEYIFENVMIFSNLFGMVRSSDYLPFYKYNQNFKYQDFSLNTFYKQLTYQIDKYLQDEEILDLRAEIYNKAYPIKSNHTRIEFFKNGKKVSHYAKHYRGIYLRELSQSPTQSLQNLSTNNLKLIESKLHKNTITLSYEII